LCRKFYAITGGSARFYEELISSNCGDKRILDYGCGLGTYACYLAKQGSVVTGIDISEQTIERAKQRASGENVSSKATFLVMNAEHLELDDDSYDIVCGSAILHHLELNIALAEISRVLKPEGKAFFIEPLGHNCLINLYRSITPQLRSRDEHPLLMRDLKLMCNYFRGVDTRCFHLTTLFLIPFRKFPGFDFLIKAAEKVDNILFKVPFFKRFAWQVVIMLSKPKKAGRKAVEQL